MLLTIKQPTHQGYKSFHDYTPPTPPSTSRFSISSLSVSSSTTEPMSTHHRGLPPPAGLNLPTAQQTTHQPVQQPPPIAQPILNQSIGQLPAPPQQWQGAEEAMRNWLQAKAEEDKRKQEEEKTRQESLRLEQRKIEQDMLRTSLSGGIPPHMIPMVFAGIGGGSLPAASLELAQHYMAQAHNLQQQQQIQQQPLLPSSQSQQSPEQIQRGDSRAAAQVYVQHPAPITLPSTPVASGSQQSGGGFLPGYQMSPASRNRQLAQGTIIRQPQGSQLPRLNTGEIQIQPPPPGPTIQVVPGQPNHPLQQPQTSQPQEVQSPSIYFHHWQPPTSQASTSDHTNSPKKRKATGPQQAAPPPTSQPQYTSPPFSQTGSSVSNTPQSRRRGHSRQRSDLSSKGGDSYGRHRQGESSFSTQTAASPRELSEQGQSSGELRRRSGGSNPVSSLLEQSDTRPQPQSHSQSQPRQRSPHHSAGSEMRQDERHMTPEMDESRRTKMIKRDDGRD
ncbi:hypothetical protein B0O99DRAFT_655991 [Bisporella sp. PMI_857]|nr:hypothetical protein B0O99DRAFT_655991 [Bisporella sp. PMI_857]